jgi:8-oxo-dGTP pyrophosphatase MutT (NUDIX family)
VEPGEGLLDALAREIEEETGWTLVGTPTLVQVADWEGRREFDFLVDVEGDLSRPRLEVPQHVEFRWLGPSDLDLLDENQDVDGGQIRRLVELALRLTQQLPGTGRVANGHVGGQSADVARGDSA